MENSDVDMPGPEIGLGDYDKAIAAFFNACDDSQVLFAEKNKGYGNAIVTTGVLGASVEIIGAAARLRKLVLTNPKHGRDQRQALEDVYKDLHNYANIALIMLRDNNWEGI